MKKFIAGFVCAVILLTSNVAFAETMETIQAVFGRIKLVVDGKAVNQETLLYNGTTYVPLRAAAEALGKEVSYDEESMTAYIGDAIAEKAITNPPTPSNEPDPKVSQLSNEKELKAYLEKTYPEVNTEKGNCKLSYSIMYNNSKNIPFDYLIRIEYDHSFAYEVLNSKSISKDDAANFKMAFKTKMETIANDLISRMQGQKLVCSYYYGYYRYPTIQEDLVTYDDYAWNNYGFYRLYSGLPYSSFDATNTITWISDTGSYTLLS